MPKQQFFTEEMAKSIFIFQPSAQKDHQCNIGKITLWKKPNIKKTIRKQRLAIK